MSGDDGFSDNIDGIIASHRRANDIYEQEMLGFEYWEYAWVDPDELNSWSADRWKIPYTPTWRDGKLLMERKRLADDAALREITGMEAA